MKIKRLLIAMATLGTLTGLLATGCGTVRGGYESAPYQVLRRDGNVELRRYPALVVVETRMRGSDDSFMRLFRFISGGNAAQQKIAMTTPVFFSGDEANETMAFVMPKKMSADAAPKPSDPAVSVAEIPGGEFAVLRYSGGRSARSQDEKLAELRAWLARENLKPEGTPIYGYFDPPWTPAFLRRNEVMLRLAKAPAP